jgi:hypothetical protein
MDSDPSIASQKLHTNLAAIQNWFKKWRMEANGSKSVHITFTTQKINVPPGPYKQCTTPPRRRRYVYQAAP